MLMNQLASFFASYIICCFCLPMASLTPNWPISCRSHYFGHFKVERSGLTKPCRKKNSGTWSFVYNVWLPPPRGHTYHGEQKCGLRGGYPCMVLYFCLGLIFLKGKLLAIAHYQGMFLQELESNKKSLSSARKGARM